MFSIVVIRKVYDPTVCDELCGGGCLSKTMFLKWEKKKLLYSGLISSGFFLMLLLDLSFYWKTAKYLWRWIQLQLEKMWAALKWKAKFFCFFFINHIQKITHYTVPSMSYCQCFFFSFFHHFNLCGLLAAKRFSLFSPHQFVQYFQQLCVTANSQWSYCTLFALAS